MVSRTGSGAVKSTDLGAPVNAVACGRYRVQILVPPSYMVVSNITGVPIKSSIVLYNTYVHVPASIAGLIDGSLVSAYGADCGNCHLVLN